MYSSMMQHCHERYRQFASKGERHAMSIKSKSTQIYAMSEDVCSLAPFLFSNVTVYRYLFMKSSWNLTIDPTHSVPGARNVVLKCSVPSFWPKPLPATRQTPVASSSFRQ